MDYKAEITVKGNADEIFRLLQPEKISRERSTLELLKKEGEIVITVEAADAVALRAAMNALTQVLAVHSRMKEASSA